MESLYLRLNAILSDLIYTRVLEPSSKSSSFRAAKQFLEPPTYELHDVYRALSVLASEMDFIHPHEILFWQY